MHPGDPAMTILNEGMESWKYGTLLDKNLDRLHSNPVSMASADTSSSDKEQVIPTIDADQAHALLCSGHGYIDVRMREDFDKGHAPGARNVPYYLSVTPQGKEKNPLFGKDDVFIVGCNTGNRSRFATADLLTVGFKNARNLQGGYRPFLRNANQQPAQQQ